MPNPITMEDWLRWERGLEPKHPQDIQELVYSPKVTKGRTYRQRLTKHEAAVIAIALNKEQPCVRLKAE